MCFTRHAPREAAQIARCLWLLESPRVHPHIVPHCARECGHKRCTVESATNVALGSKPAPRGDIAIEKLYLLPVVLPESLPEMFT